MDAPDRQQMRPELRPLDVPDASVATLSAAGTDWAEPRPQGPTATTPRLDSGMNFVIR